jgi:SRSO17 transposase
MIERAATAGIPFGWVTADEAYGDNGPLRACLEERGIAYVLAVARAHVLTAPAGRQRADALAAKLPRRACSVSAAATEPKASAATTGRSPHRAGRRSSC